MVRSASSRVSNHELVGLILRDATLRVAPQDEVCVSRMLRSAPLLRRGALLNRDPFESVGPGSAEQREEALHRVRDTDA
jgi:hypothetical protein